MKLKCGCEATPGMNIVVAEKLTTMFIPHAIACYRGKKAKIISSEPMPGYIIGIQAKLSSGETGHVLTDSWMCDISCQAFKDWLNKQ